MATRSRALSKRFLLFAIVCIWFAIYQVFRVRQESNLDDARSRIIEHDKKLPTIQFDDDTKQQASGDEADFSANLQTGRSPRNVTIIAACRNRQRHLLLALDSWLNVHWASHVVLVDWSSEPSIAESLPNHIVREEAGANRPRLKIVQVEGQDRWILSWAVNLAASFVDPRDPYAEILKVDCDTVLSSDFLEVHEVQNGEYFAGDWRIARIADETHLNGVVLLKAADFHGIGGFDQRIQTYGWDDSDLYSRLNATGLKARHFDLNRMSHITHGDDQRHGLKSIRDSKRSSHSENGLLLEEEDIQNDPTKVLLPKFMALSAGSPDLNNYINRLASERLPPWSPALNISRPQYSFEAMVGTHVKGRTREFEMAAKNGEWCIARVVPETETPMNRLLIRENEREAIYRVPAQTFLANEMNVPWETVKRLPTDYLVRMAITYNMATLQKNAKIVNKHGSVNSILLLVVHVQHGLGNRLRALASAIALARKTNRSLRVVWERDAHVNASFSDLFELDPDLVEDVWPEWSPLEADDPGFFDVYNYMDAEEGGIKDEHIRAESPRHIYVKTAYILNNPLITKEDVETILRMLTPSRAVQDAMGFVDGPQSLNHDERWLGVHVRHMDPRDEIPNLPTDTYKEADWAIMASHRAQAREELFAREIKRIFKEHPTTHFYISADSTKTMGRLQDALRTQSSDGVDVSKLWKNLRFQANACETRATRCIQEALVDLLYLGRCKDGILGSFWSSFSEVAGYLAGVEPLMAAHDFGADSVADMISNTKHVQHSKMDNEKADGHANGGGSQGFAKESPHEEKQLSIQSTPESSIKDSAESSQELGILWIYWNNVQSYARQLPVKRDYRLKEFRKSVSSIAQHLGSQLASFDERESEQILGQEGKHGNANSDGSAVYMQVFTDSPSSISYHVGAVGIRSELMRIKEIQSGSTLDGESVETLLQRDSENNANSDILPQKLAKIHSLARSPFATTLYLDTDSFVCADPTTDIKSILTKYDSMYLEDGGDGEDGEDGDEGVDILLAKEHHRPAQSDFAWNSGVIVFRTHHARTQKFFRLWEQIYLHDCVLSKKSDLDMCALHTALKRAQQEFDLRVGELPAEYNYRVSLENWASDDLDKDATVVDAQQRLQLERRRVHSQTAKKSVKIIHTRRWFKTRWLQSQELCDLINKHGSVPRVLALDSKGEPIVLYSQDECKRHTGKNCMTVFNF
ncbi:hypothetical protein HK102_000418 [Quaeritorhiza haematococci]|nr:hypothetical protein HK102_000418 [Quaeritorhiza haematococci]